MSKDLNKLLLTGNLGRDPQLRATPNGTMVATLSVASNRSVKQADGSYREQPEWFRVVLFNALAERATQYLGKGSKVLIEGRLQTREWQDQQGQKRFTTEVIASELLMLGQGSTNPSSADADEDYQALTTGGGEEEPGEEELEFAGLPF